MSLHVEGNRKFSDDVLDVEESVCVPSLWFLVLGRPLLGAQSAFVLVVTRFLERWCFTLPSVRSETPKAPAGQPVHPVSNVWSFPRLAERMSEVSDPWEADSCTCVTGGGISSSV